MSAATKFFTLEEANRTLPLVKRIVNDILNTGESLRGLYASASAIGTLPEEEIGRASEQLEQLFGELESVGCSYRDWNFTLGLVDFPAVLDGRAVCLCWKSDEEEVGYYHETAAGFAGRKPIPAEQP